jgi:hypothetical protein
LLHSSKKWSLRQTRAAFCFVPSSRAEINIIADYTRQREAGPADKYTVIDPTNARLAAGNTNIAIPLFGTP